MTAPTDTEKREAVVRWARATGMYNEHNGADVVLLHPWSFRAENGHFEIYTAKHARAGRTIDGWTVDADTALLACLLLDAGLTVDVGRCPECEARGCGPGRKLARFEWQRLLGSRTEVTRWRGYWEREWSDTAILPFANGVVGWIPAQYWLVASRPCQTCNADPNYRHIIEAARIVLDAALYCAVDVSTPEQWSRYAAQGTRDARDRRRRAQERLGVLADRLQGAGDPLGEWLLRWLLGHAGWQETAIRKLDAVSKARAKCPTCPDAATGACCTCSSVIPVDERELAPNPYASEIHDDNSLHLMCDRCAYEATQDV